MTRSGLARILVQWTAAFAVLLASSVALAADPPPAAPAGKGKPKTIKLDEISVEGRIQKPQAFYILPRSNLNYSALDKQDSLLPRIRKAAQSDPF